MVILNNTATNEKMDIQHIEQVKQNVIKAINRYTLDAKLTFTPNNEFTASAKTKGQLARAMAAISNVAFIKHVESDECDTLGQLAFYEVREFMI
jgi:hypothetical protein